MNDKTTSLTDVNVEKTKFRVGTEVGEMKNFFFAIKKARDHVDGKNWKSVPVADMNDEKERMDSVVVKHYENWKVWRELTGDSHGTSLNISLVINASRVFHCFWIEAIKEVLTLLYFFSGDKTKVAGVCGELLLFAHKRGKSIICFNQKRD